MMTLIACAYICCAVAMAVYVYRDLRSSNIRNPFDAETALVLGAFWPLTLLVLVVAAALEASHDRQ